jgi:hypothetical protein
MDPTDRDLAIRAVLAEAGPKADGVSQAAVANVIRNRLSKGSYGDSVAKIVTAPYQFEPFLHAGTGKNNDPMRPSPTDEEYQKAGNIVDAVFSGEHPDPTGGATHFYSPAGQSKLGRSPPSWASGDPTAEIGGHKFYALAGGSAPGTGVIGGQNVSYTDGSGGGQPMNPQQQLFQQMQQALAQGQQPQQHHAGLLGQLLFGQGGLSGVIGKQLPNGLLGGLFGGGKASAPAGAQPVTSTPAPMAPAPTTQMAGGPGATTPAAGGAPQPATSPLAALFGLGGGKPAPTTPFSPAPTAQQQAGAPNSILAALAQMFGAGGQA